MIHAKILKRAKLFIIQIKKVLSLTNFLTLISDCSVYKKYFVMHDSLLWF